MVRLRDLELHFRSLSFARFDADRVRLANADSLAQAAADAGVHIDDRACPHAGLERTDGAGFEARPASKIVVRVAQIEIDFGFAHLSFLLNVDQSLGDELQRAARTGFGAAEVIGLDSAAQHAGLLARLDVRCAGSL